MALNDRRTFSILDPSCDLSWGVSLATVIVTTLIYSVGIIILAMLTIRAGYNRRSMHAIILKIFLSYYSTIFLVLDLSKNVLGILSGINSIELFPVHCLFGHSDRQIDRLFTMVVTYSLLPVFLIFTSTGLSFLFYIYIRRRYVPVYQKNMHRLSVLRASGLKDIADRLQEEIYGDRILGIWRYAKSSRLTFLKDMMTIYIIIGVTFYTEGISKSLVLLRSDVQEIYMIQENVEIFRYQVFAGSYLLFWALGVPLLCLSLVARHRNELHSLQVRQRYGFLYNGYTMSRWYWETVIFLRKGLGHGVILLANFGNPAYVIEGMLLISLIFYIIQVRLRPWDKRNNGVLGRLETLALLAWNLSSLMIYIHLVSGVWLTLVITAATISYMAYSLFIEMCGWARNTTWTKQYPKKTSKQPIDSPYDDDQKDVVVSLRVRIIRPILRRMANLSIKLKNKEAKLTFVPAKSELILQSNSAPVNISGYKAPSTLEQRYFNQLISQAFIFLSNEMRLNQMNGNNLFYVFRYILIAMHVESQQKEHITRVVDLSDRAFSRAVDIMKQRKFRQDTEIANREISIKKQLADFYTGKLQNNTRRTNQQVQAALLDGILTGDYEVSAEALICNLEGLSNPVIIADAYSTLYYMEIESLTERHRSRLQNFKILREIYESNLNKTSTEKKESLLELCKVNRQNRRQNRRQAVESVLMNREIIDVTDKSMAKTRLKIQLLSDNLEKIDRGIEVIKYRTQTFINMIIESEEIGFDVYPYRVRSAVTS